MTVTKRQIEIIEYIMNNVSGITGDKLAKYFGVSSRTIRNDILQINSALKGDQLLCQTEGRLLSPSIKASKRIGYYITQEDMEYFRAVLSGGSDRNHVIAPPQPRLRDSGPHPGRGELQLIRSGRGAVLIPDGASGGSTEASQDAGG